ncbi:MAG: YfhO family protein [Burkholderiaceae bacterium]|nr:YfhO family protein [Burkholderiaceae bacterium]
MTALVTAIAGCGVIEMAPERPALVSARSDASESSELVTIITGGSLGYKAGWVIYVDGTPRAWLPTRSGFTRIPVTPGAHEVTVAFRTRELNIFLIPLPPWSGEVRERKSVMCADGARCALKAGIYLDWQRNYLVVDAEILEESQLGKELEGLPYVAPVQ